MAFVSASGRERLYASSNCFPEIEKLASNGTSEMPLDRSPGRNFAIHWRRFARIISTSHV